MKNPVIEYLNSPLPETDAHTTWIATAAVNGFDQAPVIAAGDPFAIFANMKMAIKLQFDDLEWALIDTEKLDTTDWSMFAFTNIKILTFGIGYEDKEIKITMRRTYFVGQ